MSIYDEISLRVNVGELFELAPTLGLPARRIVASNEVNELLYGDWISAEWEDRRMGLRADIDAFLQGKVVNVALPTGRPYERKETADLRLLHPWVNEIWEIRSRHANPDFSIRLLGRFAGKDCYVALTWYKRPFLGSPTSRQWRDARVSCKAEWNKFFYPYQPLTGVGLHDYISKKCILI